MIITIYILTISIFANKCIASSVENQKIILSFTGDCTIGDYNPNLKGSFTQVVSQVNNSTYFFEKVSYLFKNDDFTFVNLEGPLTNYNHRVIKEFAFRGNPGYAQILLDGGVDGANLANNHTLDCGEQGLKDTMNALSLYGMVYTYNKISFIKEIKGIKIGYIGYKGWANSAELQNEIKRQVYELRASGAKFIVANFHWGEELKYEPNTTQVNIAHFAIDNGVDLVIGHHPHVMEGREIYKGKVIVYSLGNFCFGGNRKPYDDEMIIYQHILNINDNKIVGEESNVVPVKTSSSHYINNYQPMIPEDKDFENIFSRFKYLSDKLNNK